MKKTHCKQGHEIAVVGRYPSGNCKQCTLDGAKKQRERDPEAHKAAKRTAYRLQYASDTEPLKEASRRSSRKRMGIIDATGETKSGPCDMCSIPRDRLCLDHCHTTGKIRGWLCWKCNIGLGFYEKPGWKQLADEYLRTKGHM